jgi:hypothetical protein
MAGKRKSLRDQIENRAAHQGIALRELWKWVLDAISSDALVPVLPADCPSLDTKFKLGGQSLTLRTVIKRVLPTIDSYGPPNGDWTKVLEFDDAPFDKWLRGALEDQRMSVHPKRRAGRKATLQDKVRSFIQEKYPSLGVPYKRIADDFRAEKGIPVSERTIGRALGGK